MIVETVFYHVIEWPSLHPSHLWFRDIDDEGGVGAGTLSWVVSRCKKERKSPLDPSNEDKLGNLKP